MKFFASTIAIIALAAGAAGFICYRMNCDTALHAAAAKGDTMAWLCADFHLTATQLTEIQKLQDAYAPFCEEHCRRIQEARKALAATAPEAAAKAAAGQNLRELRATCESALTRHVRQVAAVMAPADSRRYLAMVLPRIAEFDHTAGPDLQLNHPR